jgi:hypothetical protein
MDMIVLCQVGAFKFETTVCLFFLDNPNFADKKEAVIEQLKEDQGRAILTHWNSTTSEYEVVHFKRVDG